MITHDTKTEVTREGVQSESTFVIKASAKAFDIMSSNLYSDKIKAIVRELSCNARDAHVAAGNSDVPFEIHLPTYADPTFYIKDYGTGLSKEQIAGYHDEHGTFVPGLYQTFFDSTKDNTNDMIGCLGLGSKTPFAYARQFTVESRFNGKKMIFTAFKNAENIPSITMMGEADTDEPNGVTVSLGVNPNDLAKFEVAAKKALMYFDPLPNVVGASSFRPYELKHTVHGNGWRIRQSEYYAYMNGPYVVQGFVAYPIQTEMLTESNRRLSDEAKALLAVDIDMYVPIGQVDIAPSREALSYDPATIDNLINAFEAAGAEMRVRFQESFDECETYWDAAMLLDRMQAQSDAFTNVFKKLQAQAPFTWNGKEVVKNVTISLENIEHTTVRLAQLSDRGNKASFSAEWGPESITKSYDFTIQGGLTFLIDTDTKGKGDIIRQYIGDQQKINGHKPRVILIRPTSKSDYDQDEIDYILEQFQAPSFKYIKDLPYQSTKARYSAGVKRDRTTKLVWDGFKMRERRWGSDENRNFSRLTWRPETVDSADGGLFIQIERFTPLMRNGHTALDNIDSFLEAAKDLELIDGDADIIGLNEKEIAQFHKASDEWYNVIDEVASEFDQANEDGYLFQALVLEQVKNNVTNNHGDFWHSVIAMWDVVGPQLNDSAFKDAIQAIVDLRNTAPNVTTSSIRTLCGIFNINTDSIWAEAEKLSGALSAEYNKFALFGMFNWGRCGNATMREHAIKYINSVDTSDNVSDNDLRLAA